MISFNHANALKATLVICWRGSRIRSRKQLIWPKNEKWRNSSKLPLLRQSHTELLTRFQKPWLVSPCCCCCCHGFPSLVVVAPVCNLFLIIVGRMFVGKQQWSRAGYKWEWCCLWKCASVAQESAGTLWSNGSMDKPKHSDILPLQSPREFSGHWLNRIWGRGAPGKQVQSMGGVNPTAICFLFRGLGSLNALWHASWQHAPLASRTVPRHHGTMIRINPCTCAVSTMGVCFFCESAWEGERGGGGDGELHRALCESTLASHSLLLSKAAGVSVNEAMW